MDMKDRDLLGSLQKELGKDFCEPFQDEQKKECVKYYMDWIGKERDQKQANEEKQMKIPRADLSPQLIPRGQ